MQRRNSSKECFGRLRWSAPRWARAQAIDPSRCASWRRRSARIARPQTHRQNRRRFPQWIAEYKEGVEDRLRLRPSANADRCAESVEAIRRAVERVQRRDHARIRRRALEEAKIDRIPHRPNGQSRRADLIAYFYSSPDGEDFLYGVEIKRDDCRASRHIRQAPEEVDINGDP